MLHIPYPDGLIDGAVVRKQFDRCFGREAQVAIASQVQSCRIDPARARDDERFTHRTVDGFLKRGTVIGLAVRADTEPSVDDFVFCSLLIIHHRAG